MKITLVILFCCLAADEVVNADRGGRGPEKRSRTKTRNLRDVLTGNSRRTLRDEAGHAKTKRSAENARKTRFMPDTFDSTNLDPMGILSEHPEMLDSCFWVGCGGRGLSGYCYCDEPCFVHGDCCHDAWDVCPPSLPFEMFEDCNCEPDCGEYDNCCDGCFDHYPPFEFFGTCKDSCFGGSPDGCFCDEHCFRFLDCCHDVATVCPEAIPGVHSLDFTVHMNHFKWISAFEDEESQAFKQFAKRFEHEVKNAVDFVFKVKVHEIISPGTVEGTVLTIGNFTLYDFLHYIPCELSEDLEFVCMNGTCDGRCHGESEDGLCHCDVPCFYEEDCCADIADYCPAVLAEYEALQDTGVSGVDPGTVRRRR